ncbi:MAG: FtsK/SpoIIIE family DNA translocase [Endomicrobiales bacterium]
MYFRVKTKNNRQHRGLKGITLFLAAFILAYCLVLPAQGGAFGQAVANVLFAIFGQAAYLVPLLVCWFGWVYVNPSILLHLRIDIVWSLLFLLVSSCFLSLAGSVFFKAEDAAFGGWVGLKLNPFFYRLFGHYLALVITLGLSVYLASLVLRVSLKKLSVTVWGRLVEDYRQWQQAREELRRLAPPKIKAPAARPEPVKPGPVPEPKIILPPKDEIKPHREAVKKPAPAEKKNITAAASVPAPESYRLPPLELLSGDKQGGLMPGKDEHLGNAELLTKTLADFDITAKVKEIIPGPIVTRYDIELAPGIKVQAVVALSENIGLAMKSPSIRIVPIPEKSAVGVEVPNSQSCIVGLRGIMQDPEYQGSRSLLSLALGKTTDGAPYVTDLAPMPHLLIAGATGSGKSVGIHSIILSILYKARPDEVKFLLIDPKRLEMPTYRGLPHLYDPRVAADKADIITQPKEAAESLKKLVRVMELRYEKFAKAAVRNIVGYNEKMAETGGQKEFYIVVIIDELADLMLIASRDVEDSIQRLAQMARAVGIHLVLATQRPSVDVITGVIKANFPARIAFQTTSKVDSRVILDAIGADALLGKGDMLFVPPGESRPTRLQGAFVSAKEAEQVVDFIRRQNIPPQYEDLFANPNAFPDMSKAEENMQELFSALNLVRERKRVSQDLLKAHFGSSARATNILSLLETRGFIHKPEGTNRWMIYFDKINDYLNTMDGIRGQEEQ